MTGPAVMLLALLLGPDTRQATAPSAPPVRVMSGGWPVLPRTGFVSARSATNKDVDKGSAVFVMKSDKGPVGKPMKISVPQYALYLDSVAGTQTPGIIIQAEEYGELKLIGFRSVPEGKLLGGTFKEFRLLGTARPPASLVPKPGILLKATPPHP